MIGMGGTERCLHMDDKLKEKFYEGKSREEITELFFDMFYAALSRRVWLTCGEEGRTWLAAALTAFGRDRGKELAALFEKNGLEKTVPELVRCFDFIIRGVYRLREEEEQGRFQLVVEDSPRLENMKKYGKDECIELYIRTVFPALAAAFSPEIRVTGAQISLAEGQIRLHIEGPGASGGAFSGRSLDRGKEYAAAVKDLYDTMYGFIAAEVMEKAGAEGEQIVRRGIRDFGMFRGRRLRMMHEEEGLERNLFNLMDYYDIPSVEGYHEDKEVFTPVQDICNVETCNHFQRWRDKGMLRYGVMYCEEVHNAFWTAYNENIVVWQPEILTRGDGRCRFVTKIEE